MWRLPFRNVSCLGDGLNEENLDHNLPESLVIPSDEAVRKARTKRGDRLL